MKIEVEIPDMCDGFYPSRVVDGHREYLVQGQWCIADPPICLDLQGRRIENPELPKTKA